MGNRIAFWTGYILTFIPMFVYYTMTGVIKILVHRFTRRRKP